MDGVELASASRAASDTPVFDRATLDDNTMSDTDLQAELFALYFGHAPRSLDAMRAALADSAAPSSAETTSSGALSQWRGGAHALKGTASTLGFLRLARLAAEAEASWPSQERLLRLTEALGQAERVAQAQIAAAKVA